MPRAVALETAAGYGLGTRSSVRWLVIPWPQGPHSIPGHASRRLHDFGAGEHPDRYYRIRVIVPNSTIRPKLAGQNVLQFIDRGEEMTTNNCDFADKVIVIHRRCTRYRFRHRDSNCMTLWVPRVAIGATSDEAKLKEVGD